MTASATTTQNAYGEPCPKCRSDLGWSDPRYGRTEPDEETGRWSEYLQVKCLRCGYVRTMACADADGKTT